MSLEIEFFLKVLLAVVSFSFAAYKMFKKKYYFILSIILVMFAYNVMETNRIYEIEFHQRTFQADRIEIIDLKNNRIIKVAAEELFRDVHILTTRRDRFSRNIVMEEIYILNFYKNDKKINSFTLLTFTQSKIISGVQLTTLKKERVIARRKGDYRRLGQMLYRNLEKILENN
ncbi:MAG: hypothetical protein COA82_00030 [Alkaliphilus sp.]|nr:hypothetical protein [bacterium AH-315-G05]MBN4074717.1 hypothetical protein [bacterium AH-315-E09]PHS36405.1 MAG: hypothetical protein COA82_00030 [Alkaliphilus sp.]